MRFFLLCVLLIFLLFFKTAAQVDIKRGFESKYELTDLSMDIWTNKVGMVSNNVISVFQSSDDFLWITSYNGLQRFDGVKFEVFDQTNISFLSSNTFYEAAEESNGTLWFATGTSGLVGYNGRTFFQHPLNDSIPLAIISICIDRHDNLWVGTKNNGLYKVDSDGVLSKEKRIPNQTIHNIKEGADGSLWVSTDRYGIYKLSGPDIFNYDTQTGLLGDLINTSFALDEQTTYVGTMIGVNVIRGNKIESIKAFKGLIIDDLVVDDYGFLWAATNQGIVRYSLSNQSIEFVKTDDGLPSNRLIDLFFDNEGSLWVSTYEAGLVRFKTSTITNITIRNGLSSNKVNIVGVYKGYHMLGTQDGVVNMLNEEGIIQISLKNDFSKDIIRDFLFDGSVMWIGNYKGLVKIEEGRHTYYNDVNGLPNNSIRRIFKDSKSNIWLGTRNGGLIKFDEEGNHEIWDKSHGLGTNYIFDIDENMRGELLLGTNGGGLVIKKNHKFDKIAVRENDSGTLIFAIKTEPDNSAWLCTNFGLYHYDGISTRKVELYPQLKPESFFDIIDDEIGSYWLSSSTGVIRINKLEVDKYLKDETDRVEYIRYNEEDGMESEECTGATRSFLDANTGKIWVPTFEGVAIIDPSEQSNNQKIPKVLITNIQVDNTLIQPYKNNLQIKPGTFRYLFDVTALSYLAPSKVKFKYMLEGIDESWSEPTSVRKIEYTNLPYGDYKLNVIASNNDAVWSEEGASLSFSVLPFLVETMEFKVGSALFLLILFRVFYVWRVRDIKKTNRILKKMNSELDRFVYSTSHDLRGPLTSTMGLVNLGLEDKSEEKKDEYFKLIQKCNIKMDHFINEIINYSKNKNDSIELRQLSVRAVIDDVLVGLKEKNLIHDMDVEVKVDGSDDFVTDETRVKVILRNLLQNAIVFADPDKPKNKVIIDVQNLDNGMKFIVTDNGLGMPNNVLDRIFDMFYRASTQSKGSGLGLYIAKEISNKLKADLSVSSEEGKGSVFVLDLPRIN